MRKRSIRSRYILFAGVALFLSLAFFTAVLIPFEKFLLETASGVILGYNSIKNSAIHSPSNVSFDGVRVIAKRSDEFQDILLLNKRAAVGTKVVSEGALVGSIIVESSDASKVQLITSPSSKINGIVSRSGIPVELVGKGSSLLEARLPRGADVQEGDVIYTNEGGALIIGSIARIVNVVSDPFITIMVLTPVNPTTLQTVEFIR